MIDTIDLEKVKKDMMNLFNKEETVKKTAKILIIEDNIMNLEMASELLKRAGYQAIKVESAIEGIKLAKLCSPDLILMDLGLPEMDGLTATKVLKQDPLTKDIPIVAFTAMVMPGDKEKAFGAGCSGFISKPIDVHNFAADVEKYFTREFLRKEINSSSNVNNIVFPEQIYDEINNNILKYKWHKVLIVDDNLINTELLKEILDQIGQSSSITYSGKQALEVIEKEKFDLILLDIMMPEMTGFELIQRLKLNPKTADVPVLFISAVSETDDVVKGLELGSYGYITKPYDVKELKARILNILRIKDLQDELKAEKNKLDLIFKFTVDGIVILNSSLDIVTCNEQFKKWVCIEDVIGKKFSSIMQCNYEKSDNNFFEKIKLNNEITFEYLGERRVLEINNSRIDNDEFGTEGYILVIRDVTEAKKIEQQRETFVATLTHDLKTPIRAEIRAMELLLKGSFGKLTEEQNEIIQDTLQSSKYMFGMVDNLLSTYRYENGTTRLQKDNMDINSLIKSCIAGIKYSADEKQQEIIIDFENENLNVFADLLEIKRVIMNLLSNAISYTQEQGEIQIKSRVRNNFIQVSVSDNGKGIHEEDRKVLFNKFASHAKKFKQVGTGLGLYLSRQIIDAHKGDIYFESELGKGSTFTFILPI